MVAPACLCSGMFLLSACFGMFDFLACLSTFFFRPAAFDTQLRPGAGLACGRYDRQGPTALEQRCAAQTWHDNGVHFFACRLSSCRSVLVALAQLEVVDNSSSAHTESMPQSVKFNFKFDFCFVKPSAVKDVVLGSSLAALVVLAQRGKKRPEQRIPGLSYGKAAASSCCFDSQLHIRVLSFCGQVLFCFGERSVCGTAAQWSFWIGSFGNPHVSEKHIAEDSVPHVSRLNVSIWL